MHDSVLRILRVADPPRNAGQAYEPLDPNARLSTGSGGATIEAGVNLWFGSGLKMDSAPTDVVWARGSESYLLDHWRSDRS